MSHLIVGSKCTVSSHCYKKHHVLEEEHIQSYFYDRIVPVPDS